MPLFSIIVPIYNAAKTVSRCIESLLDQNCRDFELILVDDGSSDNTFSLCENYLSDARLRLFRKNNGGASSARNFGLEKAVGYYIVFADADDYVYPHWLSDFLVEPDADMVVQNIEVSSGSQSCRNLYPMEESGSWKSIVEFCMEGPWGHPVNKRFKRSIIEEYSIRFDETVSLYEDEVFFANYCAHTDILYQTGTVGYHYEEPTSFINKYKAAADIKRFVHQYELVRESNPKLTDTIIDRLALMSLHCYENTGKSSIRVLIDELSVVMDDFKKLKRRKLFLFKLLRLTDNELLWQFVFNFYLKHSSLYS